MPLKTLLGIVIVSIYISTAVSLPCMKKHVYDGNSVVCVCNSTYCDTLEAVGKLDKGEYVVYTTSKAGERFNRTLGKFTSKSNSIAPVFTIDLTKRYQSIIGFGGAFTDATGLNLKTLDPGAQNNLLKSYFGPTGIEYNVGRVPMASCDFSVRQYSYDDTPGDFNLTDFKLAPEDIHDKIPFIKQAQKLSERNITLFASPWSCPFWMKSNHNMSGKGSVIGEPGGKYYKTWANYFIKFLEEYAKKGIDFWGITAQNEPTTGLMTNYSFQTLGFTAELQRDFIAKDLGPALAGSKFKNIKLMIMDDQRVLLPAWAETVLASEEAAKYVAGIGVHWYVDFLIPPKPLSLTHDAFPDKFILATEACAGERFWEKPVLLGSWDRFERYVKDITEDLTNWVAGWTDWNLALDLEGGPNWVSNFVDSPVIVNASNNEFYKQPTFYAMGHFSKFIPQHSVRVHVQESYQELSIVAFETPENRTVAIIYNWSTSEQQYTVLDKRRGNIQQTVPAQSLQTLIWT